MRWRRGSNDHHRSAPLRRHPVAGHHREGDASPRSTTRWCSRSPQRATKPQIKEAVEKLFDVKVKSVNTLIRKGKVKAFRGSVGEQSDVKRAIVTLRRGPPHRRDDGSVRGTRRWHSRPTTPSRRASASWCMVDRSGLYRGKPVKTLDRGQAFQRRAQQQRPHHRAVPRRRPQAGLSHHRLQAAQVRRAGDGRAHRIRSQPHRLHRADQVPGRRARLYPGAAAPGAGRHRRVGRACRREAGQRHAARQHPDRHHRAQYRAQDRQGRPDRALGRHLRADRRPRPGLRHPAAELGRAAPGARPLHGAPSARCPTPTT